MKHFVCHDCIQIKNDKVRSYIYYNNTTFFIFYGLVFFSMKYLYQNYEQLCANVSKFYYFGFVEIGKPIFLCLFYFYINREKFNHCNGCIVELLPSCTIFI